MISILNTALAHLEEGVRHARPCEACGFLIGRSGNRPLITRAVASRNLAAQDRHAQFEIDPRLHLRLQRALRNSPDDILGIYHSHPGGTAAPSSTDKAQAAYPGWVWLITALDGADCTTRAWRHVGVATFEALDLVILGDPAE